MVGQECHGGEEARATRKLPSNKMFTNSNVASKDLLEQLMQHVFCRAF